MSRNPRKVRAQYRGRGSCWNHYSCSKASAKSHVSQTPRTHLLYPSARLMMPAARAGRLRSFRMHGT